MRVGRAEAVVLGREVWMLHRGIFVCERCAYRYLTLGAVELRWYYR